MEFYEDGEIIQMEINDEAAREFASEEEQSKGDLESESEQEDQNDDCDQSQNQPSTSKGKGKKTSDLRTVIDNKTNAWRESMESKIDDINSTLEVMKDMFVQSGLMEAMGKRNTDKLKMKNKGNVTLDFSQLDEASSEATVYKSALKKISTQRVDPEVSFRLVE